MKAQENKKLRGQILALENKTPPHFFSNEDSLQIQRRQKSEIENLETYIAQLEKEQCDLEKQLEATTERVTLFPLPNPP